MLGRMYVSWMMLKEVFRKFYIEVPHRCRTTTHLLVEVWVGRGQGTCGYTDPEFTKIFVKDESVFNLPQTKIPF